MLIRLENGLNCDAWVHGSTCIKLDGVELCCDVAEDEPGEPQLFEVLRLASGKSGLTLIEVCSAFSWRLHLALRFWNHTWTLTSGKFILMASSSRLYTSG